MDWAAKRVMVTGGAGFLGRLVCARLTQAGSRVFVPRSRDFDLTTEQGVARAYDEWSPDVVIHLAAEVGGIGANMRRPGRFFYANLAMGLHLIEQARQRELEKFVQVGTVCAYPKFAPVPFRETEIWDGYPEETNAPYGVAKKSLFVMLDAYRQEYGMKSAIAIPVNLYGPGDNFDLETSHVIPALIRKFVEAQDQGRSSVTCWGTGGASREFLFVEDAADGVVRTAEVMDEPTLINLGTGKEVTIRELAELLSEMCEFEGEIVWDDSKPDGQPRRCLDISRAKDLLGWQPEVSLEEGLRRTVNWYRENGRERHG